jgi:hypothetical protein
LDGEFAEAALEVIGDDEFFCKNFLLTSKRANFFG